MATTHYRPPLQAPTRSRDHGAGVSSVASGDGYHGGTTATISQYLTTHQDAMGGIWNGLAGNASNITAGVLADDLTKVTNGCLAMAHGLGLGRPPNGASARRRRSADQIW